MENNILVLKTYVDGVNDTPFPQDADSPIEIGAFRYDAKRMGGAPTITASVNYPSCLDNKWTNKVYAEFRGERYFLKQTPTSAYDNQDTMYKHDLELVSERVILDNVYFFDTVIGNPTESDKAVSNSTKVVFFGSVQEFAKRLNASLEYTKLLKWEDGVNEDGEPIKIANGYNVVVDEGIGSEEKLMSFEDQFFSNVLQEIYNQYQIPYYFVGKTIHIGFSGDVYPHTFSYGVDNALLSITKNNANFKVVNRVTGKGSTDNIPFYYPNNSPKGVIDIEVSNSEIGAKIEDYQKYSDEVKIDGVVQFVGHSFDLVRVNVADSENSVGDDYVYGQIKDRLVYSRKSGSEWFRTVINCEGETILHFFPTASVVELYERNNNGSIKNYDVTKINSRRRIIVREGVENYNANIIWEADIDSDNKPYEIPIPKKGSYTIYVALYWNHTFSLQSPNFGSFHIKYTYTATLRADAGWYYDGKGINLNNIGLSINNDAEVNIGDTITQRTVKYVNTSQNLMPSVYRHSAGKERFYNAINYPYPKYEGFDETLEEGYYGEDGIQRNALGEYEIDGMIHNDAYKEANGEYIVFKNPYFEGTPKEHVISVQDLKPTIKDTVNSMGLRMDMFSEFAYDLDDNDETEGNDSENSRDFVHSYFFGKLRILDFNLFEHAIEQQPMTISFTSGDCGACNFEIGVTEEEPQKNPVQVDENGNLIRNPETGNVVCGQFEKVTTFQDRQQDTSKYEVWIALKKEESTYGILMPKATIKEEDAEGNIIEVGGHRPKACTVNEDGTANNDGDTFVILGINLPDAYIHNAEDKLRNEIIKYIKENNTEKFNFSITFSRIFFAENPNVLEYLNENSRLNVEYNGKTYTLYVTSYSYNMGEGEALPEIKVELDDKLTVSQNAIQNAINEVKSEVSMAFANFDVLALASPYFLRKDVDDICNATIDFKKGIKFGEGGKVEVLDNNSAKLTIEYLEVTKKASFTSLEIKEKTHVGGQIIISPAAMTCGEVEELENAYRCYFQTKNAEGNDEIFNQFAENDLAICQTYNAWGSRYYWRKVVGVGEDYIDLSKSLCDELSDVPLAGDKIVQLGNTSDITRQAAIVLSAYGEDAPSFVMYNGINDFTLVDKNITGIIWNPNTLEPQMYSYGSFFFGDRNLEDNFITFQRKEGDDKKKLHIKADVTFGANSEGLSNLEEFKSIQESVSKLNRTVEEVQDQIDGVIENWSGDYNPTLNNYPVSKWEELGNSALIAHINDTFINISDGEDSGKAWRWCECFDISSFMGSSIIYSDIIPSRDWFKIGTLDKIHRYSSVRGEGFAIAITYDTDILVKEGLYIRIEKDTMDVYVLDELGYYEESPFDLIFDYLDVIQVQTDDGNYLYLHWHPISNTDDLVALKEAAEAKAKVNDLMFLSETFKKGETSISGGVVMTEMVAVGEGGDNIEAFLNGSDFAEDTENGKLILAAGILEGDADKLEERSAEATTRIYERGKIVTNNIEANGGKFKDVEVLGSSRSPFVEGAWIDGITNYLEDNHYSFNTSGGTYFPLSKDISESGRVITLVGSFAIYGSTGCRIYDRGKLYQNEYLYTGYASDLLPKTNKTDFGFELVRLMAVPYSATEVAWEVIERRPLRESSYSSAYLTGVIGGLRPKTLRNPKNSGSTNQYTLSILDHTIVCEDGVSANFTYTLPASPEIGQHYEFIKVKSSRPIIFKTTDGKEIFRIDNASSNTSQGIGASWGGKIELTYDGTQWLMVLMGS